MGGMEALFPAGVTSIEDVPADLMRAISHAINILDWKENLTEEEMPPEWMWTFDEELSFWFDDVAASRKAKFSSSDSGEDAGGGPMMSNEYARGRG